MFMRSFLGERDAESRRRGSRGRYSQPGLIVFAQLARQVKAEAGAVAGGGEKRLEDRVAQRPPGCRGRCRRRRGTAARRARRRPRVQQHHLRRRPSCRRARRQLSHRLNSTCCRWLGRSARGNVAANSISCDRRASASRSPRGTGWRPAAARRASRDVGPRRAASRRDSSSTSRTILSMRSAWRWIMPSSCWSSSAERRATRPAAGRRG